MRLNLRDNNPILESIAEKHNTLRMLDSKNKHKKLLEFFDVGTRYINLSRGKSIRSEFTDRFQNNKYASPTEVIKDYKEALLSAYPNYLHALNTAISQHN